MRRPGWLLLALLSCRTAPRPPPAVQPPPVTAVRPADVEPPAFPPQPGSVIADVEGVTVLALGAPQFASLSHDQRMLSLRVSDALNAGEATTIDQGYRHNLAIARLLRGILSQHLTLPPALTPKLRDYARVVWLNHGIHDAISGRKQLPDFTAADLRLAALAAQAAGADLGLHGASLEYVLRALEAPLFDASVDAVRTSHQPDALLNSAVNLYAAVTSRDLAGLAEKYPRNSRLAREEGALREQPWLLPRVADGLEQAMPFSAPPQREVLEPLAEYFRTGDPAAFAAAERAWRDAAGPVDFFAGFLDTSADPRGRKGLFGGALGIADRERSAALRMDTLLLAGAAGSMRPMHSFGITAGTKSVVFAAAQDAAARLGLDVAIGALAEPEWSGPLTRCAPQLRLALLGLREAALQNAEGDGAARDLSADALVDQILDPPPWLASNSCREVWPRYLATTWLASMADLPDDGAVENDRLRAIQLEIWWFTGKGALVERHVKGRRFYSVPDRASFLSAARELVVLLHDMAKAGDSARLRDLFLLHASRVDGPLRDEVRKRIKSAGGALRIAVIPPRIEPVMDAGKVVDAQAAQVTDLDAEVLRTWNQAL